MLVRIQIHNFRSFVDFECGFGQAHLLVGANGSGKTTLFDVLAKVRAFSISGWDAEKCFDEDTCTRWGVDNELHEQKFVLHVAGNGGMYEFALYLNAANWNRRPTVLAEQVYFNGEMIFSFAGGDVELYDDDGTCTNTYPFDPHRSALATLRDRTKNTKLTWFLQWLGNLIVVSPDPRQMSSLAARVSTHPARDMSNFADWYRWIVQSSEDIPFLKNVREVMDGFVALKMEDVGGRRQELKVEFMSPPKGTPKGRSSFSFDELSDGQRVLIGLYAALHFLVKPGATVCFDEPDNFIALREVQPWLEQLLAKVDDEPGAQVLIASHHPELLNRMAFESGLLFYRPHGFATRVKPFDDPAHTGLSPAELIERGWENG